MIKIPVSCVCLHSLRLSADIITQGIIIYLNILINNACPRLFSIKLNFLTFLLLNFTFHLYIKLCYASLSTSFPMTFVYLFFMHPIRSCLLHELAAEPQLYILSYDLISFLIFLRLHIQCIIEYASQQASSSFFFKSLQIE